MENIMNKVNEYINKGYEIKIYSLVEEGEIEWTAEVPDLPGCVAAGDTQAEALEMVLDAQKAWLEIALVKGMKIPEPSTKKSYSGKFLVRIPKSLHERLALNAETEGVSLNQYVQYLLSKNEHAPKQEQNISLNKLIMAERVIERSVILPINKSDWSSNPVGSNLGINQWVKFGLSKQQTSV